MNFGNYFETTTSKCTQKVCINKIGSDYFITPYPDLLKYFARKLLIYCAFNLRAGDGARTRDPQLGKLMLYH